MNEWWFEGGERWRYINVIFLYFLYCKIIFFIEISLCYFFLEEKDYKVFWDLLKIFFLRKEKKSILE